MVTNEYLISSLFNLKKNDFFSFYFMYQSIISVTFNYSNCFSCKFIFMSSINICIYIIIAVSHNSM